ncbi:MAG TPA: glycosyltransferase family 1 protein [Gemmatimonadales bacterium]
MRIAYFSEVYWPMVSGVGVTLRRLADALMARGIGVRVYTATYALPGGADRPEVHRSPSIPFFLYPDVQWALPRHRELVADARAFAPDIVHVATEFAMGHAGLRVARELGVPVVASAHTDYEQYAARYHVDWAVRPGWRYLRWFYGQAERVLCPSRIYEEHLHSRGVRRTGVWSRGVDTRTFHPDRRDESYREALGAGPGDPVVTYVGRLAREKNLDLLLAAWERIALRFPRARLALVGRGPLEREIRERAIPGVHLAGLLTGPALSAAYASADVFAFPSVTETFGNVLLEAMASGLPSIVAAAGGVLEFTEHGRNGWLVEPNSVEAIAAALERMLTDEALRARLSAGALETAAARRWDRIDDRLIAEYAGVIDAARGRSAA